MDGPRAATRSCAGGIRRLVDCGAPTYGAAPTRSALSAPTSVVPSPLGITYIADSTHATVDRIAPAPPAAWASPVITGTPAQGQTLTAGTGNWLNAPTAYSYQWQRCNASGASCISIPGATATGLTLTGADPGATVRVLVTAANAGGAGRHDPRARHRRQRRRLGDCDHRSDRGHRSGTRRLGQPGAAGGAERAGGDRDAGPWGHAHLPHRHLERSADGVCLPVEPGHPADRRGDGRHLHGHRRRSRVSA